MVQMGSDPRFCSNVSGANAVQTSEVQSLVCCLFSSFKSIEFQKETSKKQEIKEGNCNLTTNSRRLDEV